MQEFEERPVPRWVKSGLSVGSGSLLAAGLLIGLVLRDVLLFAVGSILFAIRGYLNTGDKAVAGALREQGGITAVSDPSELPEEDR